MRLDSPTSGADAEDAHARAANYADTARMCRQAARDAAAAVETLTRWSLLFSQAGQSRAHGSGGSTRPTREIEKYLGRRADGNPFVRAIAERILATAAPTVAERVRDRRAAEAAHLALLGDRRLVGWSVGHFASQHGAAAALEVLDELAREIARDYGEPAAPSCRGRTAEPAPSNGTNVVRLPRPEKIRR